MALFLFGIAVRIFVMYRFPIGNLILELFFPLYYLLSVSFIRATLNLYGEQRPLNLYERLFIPNSSTLTYVTIALNYYTS